MDALANAHAHSSSEPHMTTENTAAPGTPSKAQLWTGRVLSGIGVLFLAMDSMMKVLRAAPALEGTAQLGYPASTVQPIGILGLVCLIAYLVPQTAVLGAVLWTGYLGGAIATHVRMGGPLFAEIFPVIVAGFLWVGLWLREPRLRALLPLRAAK